MTDILKNKVISATKWSALTEISSKAISPFIFIILARLLTPSDYGLAAVAAMIISFSQIFCEAGFNKALIQRENEIEETANVIFWTNLGIGMIIYVLLFFNASFIAKLFNNELVENVIKIQGLQLIFSSISSVHIALFLREFNFKALFWIRLITTALPGLASIPLAYLGYGYWALIFGTLLGSISQLIVVWFISKWRPTFSFNKRLFKEILSFGLWLIGGGLLTWFFIWFDSFVIGAYIDSYSLGLFRAGNSFTALVFGLLLSPVLPVLFSTFSRMQNDQQHFRKTLIKVSKIVSLISIPCGFGMFVLSEDISSFVFGEKWIGVDLIIGVMALTHGFSWVIGANSEAYRGMGKADVETKIMIIALFIYLPAYLIVVQYGLTPFVYCRFLLALLAIPLHLYFGRLVLGLRVKEFVYSLKWILIASLAMVVFVELSDRFLIEEITLLWSLILKVFIGIFVYSSIIFMLEQEYIKNEVMPLLLKFIKR